MLIVVDTLRADAVSAYGKVTGTTPTIDRLALGGLRYENALSASSWTLPSHASLFTGLGMQQHGVGTPGQVVLSDDAETLAETLSAAGYETAAFSENMLVSDTFGQLQGFGWRSFTRVIPKGGDVPVDIRFILDLETYLQYWLEERDPDRPFFLFVNIFDAHSPYEVRDENPWVMPDAGRAEMEQYALRPDNWLCGALPDSRDVAILKGLYLGDVAAADAKVQMIFDKLAPLASERPLIKIVTSDHGELFGERRLLGHEFNLRQSVLHVPLVVEGVPDVAPGVVAEPVSLLDLAPTILAWAGVAPRPEYEGRPLPLGPSAPSGGERRFDAGYSDEYVLDPDQWEGIILTLSKDLPRRACGPEDKVFGSMASLLSYPFKLHWFERYPPELYDLSWDPEERFDQAEKQPQVLEKLEAEIAPFVAGARLEQDPQGRTAPDPEEIEALRALGYLD